MENWKEISKGAIPVGKYKVLVKNGEELGLIIELESDSNSVKVDFGVVSALRMLDEGILLQNTFDENALLNFKNDNFSNIIYKIQNGEFEKFIKSKCDELYGFLSLNHFVVVTTNYVIEVISRWEPTIEVMKK